MDGVGPRSTVFLGTVREHLRRPEGRHPYAMDVEVESVLYGTYRGEHIVIWGDQGSSCLPYVMRFPVGTRWVFSVWGPTSIEYFGDENYHFGFCQTNWLMSFDGCVYGSIDRRSMSVGSQEITLPELRQWMNDRSAGIEPQRAFATLPRAGDGIDPPMILERVEPEFRYDETCQPAGQSADFDVVVDRSGAVRRIDPRGEIPNCILGAAYEALSKWRFRPPTRNGIPVSAWYRISLELHRSRP